jgi:hypothetical protein
MYTVEVDDVNVNDNDAIATAIADRLNGGYSIVSVLVLNSIVKIISSIDA